jgi:hypothetical protein
MIDRDVIRSMAKYVLEMEDIYNDEHDHPLPKDSGCIDCTVGTVPDRLNTGRCMYHQAKRLLSEKALT